MSLRTEENKKEFIEASQHATSFKYAANRYVSKLGNVQGRLLARMLKAVQADSINIKGERKLLPENMQIIANFNLSENVSVLGFSFLFYSANQ